MIFTEKKITINNNECKIDSPVVLYRGDYNVEVRFTIVSSPYKYSNKQETNVIEQTEASYGQLVIKTPGDKAPIFSEITATKRGAITFTITAEMIDEITEVGNYTFQIRLLDENKESRATIPEVVNGIEIREPIATEDISNTNEVGIATVGYALTTAGTTEDAFDTQGNYNKTTWGTGDRITAAKLNKIEAGIDGVNKKVASGGTGGNVDLSNYVTKETGNANQITFADGQTFQAKLDAGTLKGEKGDQGVQGPAGSKGDKGDMGPQGAAGADGLTTAISVNGNTYTHVDGVITLPDYVNNGIVNENGGEKIKIWVGTKVEYDALLVKDEDTVYLVEGSGGGSTPVTTYTITNNLAHCTNTNNSTNINENDSYSATITPEENYKLSTATITMGGIDITNTAYTNGTIFIEHITGDVIIICTAIQNSGEIGDIPEPIYALENELTLDGTGTGTVNTGIGLFDADRDFTIFADFTPSGSIQLDAFNQEVVFRTKQTSSPWIGVDIALFLQNLSADNPSQTRGSLVAGSQKNGIYLGKMATGINSQTTDRCKVVIKRVASEQKMYFYDKQGLIGSYNDPGTVANNLFNDTVILGYGSGKSSYFTGTIHQFKIWHDTINDNDITSMLV